MKVKPKQATFQNKTCQWCGKGIHGRINCPAKNQRCLKCNKVGHYAKVCLSEKQDTEIAFLGSITNNANDCSWTVPIDIKGKTLIFKIDSGADHTVIPTSVKEEYFHGTKMLKSEKILCGPDRSPLKLQGKFFHAICYSGRTFREEIYVIDNLQSCLLGKPAIKAFGLGPNLNSSVSQVTTLQLRKDFPDLFQGLGFIKDPVSIHLKPDAVPLAISSPRRVPIPLLKKTENEIKKMIDQGVIQPVVEPTEWCSAIVVVPKTDNSVRICVDLTELNKSVKREFHPIPAVEYTLGLLDGAKIYSKLDANSGFWQIPLDEKSSYLTTFITPFGRYRFLRLPFGISSAPEIYQRKMSQILEKMQGTVCHMDDILVWGRNQEEHDKRLREVLQRLRESGLTLNEKKCEISVKRVKFLGHILDEDGIHPDGEKIAAILNLKPPSNKSELKRLLGMANYLARFVPNFSEILSPLISMLSNKNEFVWNSTQQDAFTKLKEMLTSNPVLKIFDPRKISTVSADASSYGLGATLRQQEDDGKMRVVAYASRTMSPTEQKYAQIEKEALALVWACEKFNDYILGSQFRLETDHKPLIPILSRKNLNDLSPRLQRLKLRMMRYSYSIFHTPGKELLAADALSRSPQQLDDTRDEMLSDEISSYVRMIIENLPASNQRLNEIHMEQQKDPTCKQLCEYAVHGWPSKKEMNSSCLPYWQLRHEICLQDGLLMRGCRIVIPESLRQMILDKIHEGHLGITKCRARARVSVYWPGISKQIEETVKTCNSCIKESTNRHQPLIPSQFPERPWEKLGMDLFKLGGSWYLLITDYFSRYPEVAKLEHLTASEIILHCKSIFARHGVPDVLRSDNGPQFDPLRTAEFINFTKSYGFRHITSSPHFPQSNGFVEAAVKIIKLRFKKSADPYKALLAYRATPLENGYSPSELLMNRRIKTTVPISNSLLEPLVINKPYLETKEEQRIDHQKKAYDRRHGVRDLEELKPGEGVWITNKKSAGVVQQTDDTPRSYIVQSKGKLLRRNRKHLIPAKDLEPDEESESELVISPSQSPHSPKTKTLPPSGRNDKSPPVTLQPASSYTTRSGRSVHRPDRLDL